MLISKYSEDESKWGSGAPIHVPTYDGNITFYVRRIGTPDSEKMIRDIRHSLFGPFHSTQDTDLSTIYAHWLCEFGVTGWDDLIDESTGDNVEYSKSKARELFLDESYFYSLNQVLISASANFENFLRDEKEEAIENIKKL